MQTELASQCQHRWIDLLHEYGISDKMLTGKHTKCPLCGGKDRFRFTNKHGLGYVVCNQCMPSPIDGIDFLQRVTNLTFADLAKEIRGFIGETSIRMSKPADNTKNKAANNKIWAESYPLQQHDPVHRYLAVERGLAGISFAEVMDIRHHPAMDYWNTDNPDQPYIQGKYSAMVSMVRAPSGKPATLHITYLTPDGKQAPVTNVRKIRPPSFDFAGGAVRLNHHQPGQVIAVAEGIETALSAKKMYGNQSLCVWASLTAGNMEKFIPPNETSIVIMGDNDKNMAGQKAAFALANRLLAGPNPPPDVVVSIPEKPGTDFNDQIQSTNERKAA